jgi:subtilisin family serine protease
MFKRIISVSSLIIFLSLSAFASTVYVIDSAYNGHGNKVCSIIREQAPNADVRFLKIANTPQISNYEVVSAIYNVVNKVKADSRLRSEGVVLNLSLGSSHYSQSLASAVKAAQDAGIVVVAAAGNDGPNQVNYPAALPGVISVGALDAGYSGIGDVWAPAKYPGTSFSSPHVAGVIANRMYTDRVGASEASRRVLSDARSNNGVVGGVRPGVNVVSPDNYRAPKQIVPDEEIFYGLFAFLLRSIFSDLIGSSSPYPVTTNPRVGVIDLPRRGSSNCYPIIYNGRGVDTNPFR